MFVVDTFYFGAGYAERNESFERERCGRREPKVVQASAYEIAIVLAVLYLSFFAFYPATCFFISARKHVSC